MQDRTVTLYSEMRAAWRSAGEATGLAAVPFEERFDDLAREFDARVPASFEGIAAKLRRAFFLSDTRRAVPGIARAASRLAVRFARGTAGPIEAAALRELGPLLGYVINRDPEHAEHAGLYFAIEGLADAVQALRPRALH